jgi:serine/threonine protein kinase
MHTKLFIHRDIKPDNLVTGVGKRHKIIYLIDFGLCKKYWDSKKEKHLRCRKERKLIGTARFASINSHNGLDLSRRDDLESFCYVLLYFLKGSLPWQGISGSTKEKRYRSIGETKASTTPEALFRNLPEEFA